MTSNTSLRPVSPLRARMIEDMTVRGFKQDTRRDYVRQVRAFAVLASSGLLQPAEMRHTYTVLSRALAPA